jgi:hypothetical protein
MLPAYVDRSSVRERLLGEHVRALAADLRLIELPDIVVYMKTGQLASVGALVQGSIELSFKPDTLIFGYSGDVSLDWHGRPQVAFDMEFHHQSVHVYFRMLLEAYEAGVEILCISFEGHATSPNENTIRLQRALEAAKIN